MKYHKGNIETTLGIVFVAVFIVICIGIGVFYQTATRADATIEITDKERITDGNSSKYLIFGKDETFENVDSFWNGKFNSSDIYGKLEPGKTYDCKVYGWRIPYFSSYRNIIECEEKK